MTCHGPPLATNNHVELEAMSKDDLNHQIIRQLRDGRKSFSEIAAALDVTTNTVRARVNKLMERGVMEINGVINPDKLESHFLVIVGLKLSTMNLVEKGKELTGLKGVVSVAVVTGQFDLILTVLLNDEFGLEEFYTEEVSKIKGLQSSETFVVYKNFNLKVPYVL
jgi:Lrp/AsnC family transcriptional regulator, regulator for asnA, asnC and gidA